MQLSWCEQPVWRQSFTGEVGADDGETVEEPETDDEGVPEAETDAEAESDAEAETDEVVAAEDDEGAGAEETDSEADEEDGWGAGVADADTADDEALGAGSNSQTYPALGSVGSPDAHLRSATVTHQAALRYSPPTGTRVNGAPAIEVWSASAVAAELGGGAVGRSGTRSSTRTRSGLSSVVVEGVPRRERGGEEGEGSEEDVESHGGWSAELVLGPSASCYIPLDP